MNCFAVNTSFLFEKNYMFFSIPAAFSLRLAVIGRLDPSPINLFLKKCLVLVNHTVGAKLGRIFDS